MEQQQQFQITRREVFIVRIWREESAPTWRGWIQHTGSGEIALFRDLAEILIFIKRQADDLTPVLRDGIK